jgi:hypothetical protein
VGNNRVSDTFIHIVVCLHFMCCVVSWRHSIRMKVKGNMIKLNNNTGGSNVEGFHAQVGRVM